MADPTPLYGALQPNKERFLKCLEMSGSITEACRWAKVSRQAHYYWMETDPGYEKRVQQALRRSATVLADEAIRRGKSGVRRPVFYKGKICGYVTEFSDQLLIRMMEAREPETFSQRIKQEHTGRDGRPLLDLESVRAYIQQAPEDGEKR